MSEGFILAFAFILYHSGGTSSVEPGEVCIFHLLNYSAHNPLNWTYYFKMFWAYHYTLRFANLDASASAFSVHFASLKKQYKPNICTKYSTHTHYLYSSTVWVHAETDTSCSWRKMVLAILGAYSLTNVSRHVLHPYLDKSKSANLGWRLYYFLLHRDPPENDQQIFKWFPSCHNNSWRSKVTFLWTVQYAFLKMFKLHSQIMEILWTLFSGVLSYYWWNCNLSAVCTFEYTCATISVTCQCVEI